MNKKTIFSLTIFAAALVGCSEEGAPSSGSSSTTAEQAPESVTEEVQYPRIVTKYFDPSGPEVEGGGSPITAKGAEREFLRLDWTNEATPSSLGLHLDGATSLTIRGTLGAVDESGKMVAVLAGEKDVRPLMQGISGYLNIANKNSPQQTVVAGETRSIESFMKKC